MPIRGGGGGGGGGGGSSRWVFDMSTDYADLTSSRPEGMDITEPVSGNLGAASIIGGELRMTHEGTTATRSSFNGSLTNSYGAPRIEWKATRTVTDGLEIRARLRADNLVTGSYPEFGIFMCEDQDSPVVDRTYSSIRGDGTYTINYEQGSTWTVGPNVTSNKTLWMRMAIGSMGGMNAWYSTDDETDPENVTWTLWKEGKSTTAWFYNFLMSGLSVPVRFGIAIGQDADGTQNYGTLLYLDSNITPTGV